MAATKWTKVGTLKKSKAGNLYISVAESVTLKKDANLMLKDPRKELEKSKEAGRLDAEKADAMIAKIPDFVRYDIYLVEE